MHKMNICKKKSLDRSTWGNCTKLDLYCKNLYNPIVKVSDWEKHGESLPIDVDPYRPTEFDLHYSHYNKIGGDKDPINYSTTTDDMLKQILSKRKDLEVNPNKRMTNLFTDVGAYYYCNGKKHETVVCSSSFAADFRTTMQQSYQPPYPYLLKRISMEETPYFLNRYLRDEGSSKFLDDDHVAHTKKLQMYKSNKHISYNPLTGFYTDGSIGNPADIY